MKKPLLALLVGAVFAILSADFIEVSSHRLLLSLTLIVICIYAYFISTYKKISLSLALMLSFFILHQFHLYFPNQTERHCIKFYVLSNPPEWKQNTILIHTKVIYSNPCFSLPDYCSIYIKKDSSLFQQLHPSDTIYISKKPSPLVQSDLAPFDFNFTAYFKRKRVIYSLFAQEGSFTIKATMSSAGWISSIQHNCLHTIQRAIPDKSNAALAASLIIGYRSEIDEDTINKYSKIGIIHLLSVSGLHVGIFLWLIRFVFSRFKRDMKYIRLIITLTFLIVYTCITGASIPVIRCAVMFSFIEIGKLFRRNSHVLNSLLASALLLLLYNTQFLFDIGFQLSFLALIGIVVLQPILSKKLITPYLPIQCLADMLCSTIAAWLFTFPLVAFYFHNVSLLGNLLNLIAIPLAALVLYLGMLLFVFSSSFILLQGIGSCINYLLHLLDSLVNRTLHLPFAYIDNIYWNPIYILLIYMFILLITSFIFHHSVRTLYALFLCLILIQTQRMLASKPQQHVSILIHKKSMSVAVVDNNRMIYSMSNPTPQNMNRLKLLQAYAQSDSAFLLKKPYFTFKLQTFLILDQKNYSVDSVDYLIIRTNKMKYIFNQLSQTSIRKEIIVSLPPKQYQQIIRFMKAKKIRAKCRNAATFVQLEN